MAAGDEREHGGNDGYDDDPSVHYSWDSTVPNHERPRSGDVIVLWDKETLLGASMIESIVHGEVEKTLYRCPTCGRAHIKRRKRTLPRYRCFDCREDFEDPRVVLSVVKTYRTKHDIAWVDLVGQLPADRLRELCRHPRSQLSLRQLDYRRFRAAVQSSPGMPALSPVDIAMAPALPGGHKSRVVRVRVGQGGFRSRLLSMYGDACAFTGPAPREALEAAHLYSYALNGEHHDEGGLLMRRDVHRLFDSGRIAVDLAIGAIDVAESVREFPEYARLHGRKLTIKLTKRQQAWMVAHWELHRGAV